MSRQQHSSAGPSTPITVLRCIEELDTAWLSRVLGAPIDGFSVARVGTGQSAATFRVTLTWGGDAESVILKLADSDPAVRRTGLVTGQSEREVRFNTEVAPRLPGEALARCHAAAFDRDGGYFTLLVEDLRDAQVGDQLVGCTLEQARLGVRELARLVAAAVEDPGLATWLDTGSLATGTVLEIILPEYEARYGDRLTTEHRQVLEHFVARFDSWAGDRVEPRSIVHGDYRLDNMLFGAPGADRELTIVDWATLGWGSICSDLAYFLGGNLTIEDRRTHEEDLVRLFHEELVAAGVEAFSFQQCWRGYRFQSFAGVLMAFGAPMVVTQTERGDEMFMTMLARHCQQVIDLESMALLDEAHTRNLQVDPADEGRHTPGTDRYWGESWYLDAISDDGTVGAYVRIGYVPNLERTVYTAYIVGEGRPSVAVLDYEAPLPPAGLAVETSRFTSRLVIEQPLERMRATVSGTGESYEDAAAPLRGDPGRPVDVELDLVWETDGVPYMYQQATRYEMPCRVTGTLRIGDEVLSFAGPGQRDHSWGDRNWWMMDWVWASAHMDDGTHVQVIEGRLPGLPVMAAGYEQKDAGLTEIKSLGAAYEIPATRMPGLTRGTLRETDLTWEPIAYGPLRLVAPDGRVCEFPRAMARVRAPDGRTGLGWLEWGHNVDPDNQPGTLGRVARELGARVEPTARRHAARVPDRALEKVMGSRAGRHVVAGMFRALERRIDPRRAQIADAIVRFSVTDARRGEVDVYDLVLHVVGSPRIVRHRAAASIAAAGEPRVSLTMSGADLLAMGLGRLDTTKAVLERRITVEGELMFMATITTLLAGDAFPQQQPL